MVPLLDGRDVRYTFYLYSAIGLETDMSFSNINKVRIISLYIQYRDGVPDEDRRRLYQHARLSLAEQDAVNALAHMGVRLNRVRNSSPN